MPPMLEEQTLVAAGVNLGLGMGLVTSVRRLDQTLQQATVEIRKPRVTGPPRRP